MQDFNETMLDLFVFETAQQIEQLETAMLSSEKSRSFTEAAINEIFRIMHTIKSSAAMMMFDSMSLLAHSVEDLFFCLREEQPQDLDFSQLSDLVFASIDFMKVELEKIKNGDSPDGQVDGLIKSVNDFLAGLKTGESLPCDEQRISPRPSGTSQKYYIPPVQAASAPARQFFKAVVYFQDGCQMEDVRAFGIVHRLKEIADQLFYIPADIVENDDTAEIIQKNGFQLYFSTELTYSEIHEFFMQTVFLQELELVELEDQDEVEKLFGGKNKALVQPAEPAGAAAEVEVEERKLAEIQAHNLQTMSGQQSFISVSVSRLDTLMDLVGEMVIAEAMVVQNPDLQGLELSNFYKAAEQLNKITGEIQNAVMSARMVSLSTTFFKMRRVVRDMSKQLAKEIELEIIGENTEVDKNVIEHISDPLMHLVRNAADHGIESCEERLAAGKPRAGTITLAAKNLGSDVLINIRDDGRGMSRDQVVKKAIERGLLEKADENMSDREVFNLILLPGFSTKETVSQFSGRGVGMNVVTENIEAIGGSVFVDSTFGEGTTVSLKIPLTLAIIDGMNLKVGKSRYTLPTIAIRESFRPRKEDIIIDPDGNEMILVRGRARPIVRLHALYNVETEITNFENGILIMIEQDEKSVCLFVDELLGQQQVVVKSLPEYITRFKKIRGLAGCTLLGDGSISLILEPGGLVDL